MYRWVVKRPRRVKLMGETQKKGLGQTQGEGRSRDSWTDPVGVDQKTQRGSARYGPKGSQGVELVGMA